MDGCVHTVGPSKTGGGVLEDRGAANPKQVCVCLGVFLWLYLQEEASGEGCQESDVTW